MMSKKADAKDTNRLPATGMVPGILVFKTEEKSKIKIEADSLAAQVDRLSTKCKELELLCGETIATLMSPRNRETLRRGEGVEFLLDIFDTYWDRFERIRGTENVAEKGTPT